MKQDIMQQKYMEFQLLSRQMNMITQQIELINNKILELRMLSQSVADISNEANNTPILVPLGAGIMIKALIKDSKNIYMNVGSDIIVIKTPEEAKSVIEVQISELEKALLQTESELNEINSTIESIQNELRNSNE